MYEKIVVVTRKTRLAELIARFNTKAQAKFYIEHAGGDFEDYQKEDDAYNRSLSQLRKSLDFGLKVQFVERIFLPSFLFSACDLIVAVGQDGLVANTAKYVGSQPIVGVNPDPERFDGILSPVKVPQARKCIESVLDDSAEIKQVTLAEVVMNDGQRLLAFNDLFIGARTHVSARYRLEFQGKSENQSSSGLIVSTGAGSTGWLSSVFNMVSSVNQFMGGQSTRPLKLSWGDCQLVFVVREPFVSKHSAAGIVAGILKEGQELIVESRMPCEGTIFSDGVEADFLSFNSGLEAHVRAADQKARLVLPFAHKESRQRSAAGAERRLAAR